MPNRAAIYFFNVLLSPFCELAGEGSSNNPRSPVPVNVNAHISDRLFERWKVKVVLADLLLSTLRDEFLLLYSRTPFCKIKKFCDWLLNKITSKINTKNRYHYSLCTDLYGDLPELMVQNKN